MQRKKWMKEADELMQDYCKDCFLYRQNKVEYGKRGAHRFCISQCTVGNKLKEYGEKLSSSK
ncbi:MULTISPECIES: zinc-finger domain-containing protein [Niallia]|uniref:Uncharacterized protein n=1 Tax=Niallia circulans TaxID=1397 RepID=A0A268F9Y9_NIACI|nr:zinc-finger domain-containing protein [Niallia circulans]AYV66810.1 zinc-finger domain-containing protein [Niallia circulans]AYV70335.1 zinc-finger domain-containing protein [Niallia circulans]NRG27237.1 zinc-finger domain-containing protein [Niallia circulans]PAD82178.1 hypothetical protein CHH57_16715 [Niallia circulans]QJX62701.1 zinc-finger domain-containing protein [Niallia circulans]